MRTLQRTAASQFSAAPTTLFAYRTLMTRSSPASNGALTAPRAGLGITHPMPATAMLVQRRFQ